MHVITRQLSKLSKNEKDEFFKKLGFSNSEVRRIRKLPPKNRILEAARIASSVDPTPNSDMIEWLAGYSWRGALYHHYNSLGELLNSVNIKSSFKRPERIINLKENQLDILNIIPENAESSNVWVDSEGNYLNIWQKRGVKIPPIKLKRIVNKNLFLVGIALYAGEGSKTPSTTRKVEIVNTNPIIIKIFIRFLENIGISRNKLKARIHAHSIKEAERGIKFWSDELNIKNKQFLQPLLKKSNSQKINVDKMPAIDIQYNNSMMRFLITNWVNNLNKLM